MVVDENAGCDVHGGNEDVTVAQLRVGPNLLDLLGDIENLVTILRVERDVLSMGNQDSASPESRRTGPVKIELVGQTGRSTACLAVECLGVFGRFADLKVAHSKAGGFYVDYPSPLGYCAGHYRRCSCLFKRSGYSGHNRRYQRSRLR